jgi:tRNA pseudouridine55 synthase
MREIDEAETRELSFGRSLTPRAIDGVYGAFAEDGTVIALLRETDGAARPVLVFAPAG